MNDNAPIFDHIPDSCISVTEFHEIGDIIIALKAFDADDPSTPNGKISFHIEQRNEFGKYTLPKDSISKEYYSFVSTYAGNLEL